MQRAIHSSLARCYEVASLLSWFHPDGVEFRVYADGHKYRRACLTPPALIDDYPDQLSIGATTDQAHQNA